MSDIKHVMLAEDSNCVFCGTSVKKGCSVCPNCGAQYGYNTDLSQKPFLNLIRVLWMVVVLFLTFGFAFVEGFMNHALGFFILFAGILIAYLPTILIKNSFKKNIDWWR